jgi:hypothetical protein
MTDIKLPKLVQLTVPMTPIAYDVKRQNWRKNILIAQFLENSLLDRYQTFYTWTS